MLILEDKERALKRGVPIYGELLGYALGGEAFHITAPEETGTEEARIMREALRDAGIAAHEVDYLNAHGTGTILNDRVETLAIKEVWGADALSAPRQLHQIDDRALSGGSRRVGGSRFVVVHQSRLYPPDRRF